MFQFFTFRKVFYEHHTHTLCFYVHLHSNASALKYSCNCRKQLMRWDPKKRRTIFFLVDLDDACHFCVHICAWERGVTYILCALMFHKLSVKQNFQSLFAYFAATCASREKRSIHSRELCSRHIEVEHFFYHKMQQAFQILGRPWIAFTLEMNPSWENKVARNANNITFLERF